VAIESEKHTLTEAVGGRSRSQADLPRTGNKVVRFFKALGHEVLDDQIDNVGAMMAYYAVLALFPMLVFIITLAMLVLDDATVQQGVAMATETMPPAISSLISTQIQKLLDNAQAGFAITSAVFALWGASRGAVALSGALNAMYNKEETRPWWKRQLIAIGVSWIVLASAAPSTRSGASAGGSAPACS
jgi:membrane protein